MQTFRRPLSSSTSAVLKQTPLFSRHQQLGGKLVPFAGYSLPVLYDGAGIVKEHNHTRTQASLFDVSHMGQVKIKGKDRIAFIETLICADVAGLKQGEASLTVFTNENGGVIDDAIIANAGDYLHLVVNGACKEKDIAHMRKHLASSKFQVQLDVLENPTLMALQGPRAAEALKALKVNVNLDKMAFMTGQDAEIAGVKCRLTRCGYTGEDGFEISCETDGPKVFDALMNNSFVKPCGLGARDSLRLEAGLCLYGHELDETILPVEASLAWVVNKNRRTGDRANFLGSSHVLAQLSKASPPKRKRVGLVVNGAPAREGAKLFSEGKEVGIITSGTFSPTLNKPIAMGYVPAGLSSIGTKLFAQVRGKDVPVVVEKMPFVPSKYFKVA